MKQGTMGWQWHHLHCLQIICISLETDNHVITIFLQAGCSSWRPTNNVKALKAQYESVQITAFTACKWMLFKIRTHYAKSLEWSCIHCFRSENLKQYMYSNFLPRLWHRSGSIVNILKRLVTFRVRRSRGTMYTACRSPNSHTTARI